jgi:uncharacterized caspase-like protein
VSAFRPILRRLLLLALLALGAAGQAQAQAQAQAQTQADRRIALVIGNNAYPTAPLQNPVNDARAMARSLESAGFTVILKLDAAQPDLLGALRDFGNRLKEGGPGTAGLFYFAGHGMQIKGRNFLIPVGTNIEHEDEVTYQALDAQAVMDKMESAGNGTNIVILDACRNNPFVRSFRSGRQGLAQMDAPVGTLVAFSTAPGSVASDGNGINGLYTAHLLNVLRKPGLKVEDVFKQVRMAVLRESGNRQVPWEASSLIGDFYFRAPSEAPAFAAAPPAPAEPVDALAALDDALWGAVKDSSSSAEIYAYLNRFPGGRHARLARTRMADLVAPSPSPLPSSARPAVTPQDIDQLLRDTADRERQADVAQSQQRVDEIVRWGDVGTDRRPAQPRRNASGFAEGDRYRYRVLNQVSSRYTGDFLWRIDRIDADGSLWVNDGRQRLDALGQLRGGNDEVTGQWVDWAPALPVAAALKAPPGAELAVRTTVQMRDAEGRLTQAELRGRLIGGVDEHVMTQNGLTPARRVEAYLEGDATVAATLRFKLTLNMWWWYQPGVGLPVKFMVEERADDKLVRRHVHEVMALDVMSLGPSKP